MASVATYTRQGVNASAAIKVPCKAATTANITLSGEQTIDGISIVTNDRVLVKNQTDASENGIYIADTSAWNRAPDWDGAYDVQAGTITYVYSGTANTGWWKVTTTGTITVGTTDVTIAASGLGDAEDVTYNQGGTGAVDRTQESKNQEFVSVKDFGAVGDGVTDDTSKIQSAVNSGSLVIIVPDGTYKITSRITIPTGVTLRGAGGKIYSTISGASSAFYISSSNVTIENLEIYGVGNSSYIASNYLIEITGTNNSPSAPTYITNINIRNNYLHSVGSGAVYTKYVDTGDFSHNRIESCGREGMMFLSCKYIKSNDNYIEDITPGDGSGDAYGISHTKISAPLTEDPAPLHCTINNNIIKDVTSWTGIDSHGGKYITISGNTLGGCKIGIGLVKADDGAGTEVAACEFCSVTGNTMTGLNTSPGIIVTGQQSDSLYPLCNSVTGNTIENYGDPDNANSGAINIDVSKQTSVVGNTILYPGACGVALGSNNYGFTITGNVIRDPYSDTVTAPRYVSCRSTDNYGSITGNTFIRDNTSKATYVGVRGVELNNSTTEVNASFNYNEATSKNIISSTGKFIYPPIVQSGDASGTASTSANTLDIAVSFPDSFTVTPDIVVSANNASATAGGTNSVHVISASTTGFTARITTTDLANFSSAHNYTVYWTASGY